MNDRRPERLLGGDPESFKRNVAALEEQSVDLDMIDANPLPPPRYQTALSEPVQVRGPGTFFGKAIRTLTLEPWRREGWWIDRTDLAHALPTRVSIRNVWTTGRLIRNIVLRSGSPHNYIRMVEHIICLRLGLGLDNVMIRIESGDPPLFEHGSLDLVEAVERARPRETQTPIRYVTVREPVAMCTAGGSLLLFEPASPGRLVLDIDCAIDFDNIIGKQRILFTLTPERFKDAALARTNTSALKILYCRSIGMLFADIRNLGYTSSNILVAGKTRYINEPRLLSGDKSLEAVWHRAALDLLAALALIDDGRFVGRVRSYKAGHELDVNLITQLYLNDLLEEIKPPALEEPRHEDI
jgi:UDP-3-O-acyl-N-acetylglucosamine deacetylase